MGTQRTLSIRQLQLVALLGAERNLSRTAGMLFMTQPAASRALAQLEQAIGVRLFDRTTSRIVPTSAGLRLMHHARLVLEQLDQAQADLAGHTGGGRELRIGTIASFSSVLLGEALAQMGSMLPDLRLLVRSATSVQLYEDLLRGGIDAMLCHAELSVDLNRVEVVAIYEEATQILCAAQHPLARRKKLQWPELAAQRWLLPPPQTPLRAKLDRMIAVHRGPGQAVVDIEVDSAQVALALLARGGCLWSAAGREAQSYAASRAVKILAQPGALLRGPMCCLMLRGARDDAMVRVLRQCLQAAGDQLAPQVEDLDAHAVF